MIAQQHDDILFCEQCSPRKNIILANRLVGPGTVFEKACPHVELVFLAWHEQLKTKEPPAFKHLWQPFCIGFLLGASIVFQFLP